ncbi:MAG: DNA methyltransferase, partial [Pirellulaceae bacterium]
GCQMPEQLLARIILVSSKPGEVVLDPFGGSGSTLVVARKLGREPIGFELSEDYARQGNERLGGTRSGDPLAGAADPRVSAPPSQSTSAKARSGRSTRKGSSSKSPMLKLDEST